MIYTSAWYSNELHTNWLWGIPNPQAHDFIELYYLTVYTSLCIAESLMTLEPQFDAAPEPCPATRQKQPRQKQKKAAQSEDSNGKFLAAASYG